MSLLIKLLPAIIIVGGLWALYFTVARKLRLLSRKFFGTENLSQGLKDAKTAYEAAERSISAMTGLMLPQIQRDFPMFNWEEYKLKIEDSVRDYIAENASKDGIQLHRTEISDYRRSEGTCIIKAQTSAGYTGKNGEHLENKYESALLYVQDPGKLPETQTGTGLNCPNCGAPVTNLGKKFCEFCGTPITEINIRVWKLSYTKQIN